MTAPFELEFAYAPPREPWLTVLFADEHLIVLDKPSGLLTVPGIHPDLADSLQTRARERWPSATVVHRLDKDTSGVIVLALTTPALAGVGKQFENRKTKKHYVARVWGHM